MNSPSACYQCRFFHFDSGYPAFSEYIPGARADFGCCRGYWNKSMVDDERDFRLCITKASSCEEFEPLEKYAPLFDGDL